jgi:hypothetical protein
MRKILREMVAPLSVLSIVLGTLLLIMGSVWIWFSSAELGPFDDLVKNFGDWNYYLFVIGIALFLAGIWYLYDFFKKRRFLLEEIKTGKRSELIRKRLELENVAKKLPSKYERMFEDRKRELKIK